MNKKLNRSVKDKVIGGVAGGLAEYFEIDPVIVRVLFVVSLFFHGAGLIAYIVLCFFTEQDLLPI
jgi:phage shock protein C